MEDNRRVILETKNLKQHFPTGRKIGGQKTFVKANDGINLSLYEGKL